MDKHKELKKITKKIGIIFAIIIVMQIFAIILGENIFNNVSRAETYGDFEYTVDSETNSVTINKYTGDATEVTIPSTIDGKNVTSIGDWAFEDCSSLTSINIPEGVTSIGDWAFSGCRSLTSINIPEGVTSIGNSAFNECSSLTSINVVDGNQNYKSESGILFNKSGTMILKYPEGKNDIAEYNIPEGVTSIGWSAFYRCSSLTSINIPEGVTSIGDWAFDECSGLTSINIPEGVTSIGEGAFSECSSLTSINIPEGVTSIGDYAFNGCSSLTSINIPEGVTSIGNSAFSGCSSLTSINIPEGVTSIGNWAFSGCSSLTNINIPEGVTSIGGSAFSGCSSLTSINIPEGATSIGDWAFDYCELYVGRNSTEIELPQIIKRAINANDILYSSNGFQLTNCSLNEDNTKLVIDDNIEENQGVSLYVKSGKLCGLSLNVIRSGTILYSSDIFTNKNVVAQLILEEGESITNNDGKNYYVFEQNGEFTFEYITKSGEKKMAKAEVTKIDKEGPKVQIKTENTEKNNKIKVIINSDEEMVNIDKLDLANKTYIESWQISEDEKELTIIYVNNTEEDMKIEDKFEVEDHLGNKSMVDLSKENIIIKIVKGDINGDNKVDAADLFLVKRHLIAGQKENWVLTGEELKSADIDKDGVVNISDLLYLKRMILNIK